MTTTQKPIEHLHGPRPVRDTTEMENQKTLTSRGGQPSKENRMNTHKTTGGPGVSRQERPDWAAPVTSVRGSLLRERPKRQKSDGRFPEQLRLELPPFAARPTVEASIYGALTLFQAL